MSASSADRHLMFYDISNQGHNVGFIHHLTAQARRMEFDGTLYLVVSPEFVRDQPATIALAAGNRRPQMEVVAISDDELRGLRAAQHYSRGQPFSLGLQDQLDPASFPAWEWATLERYANRLQATHIFVSTLDSCLQPLAAGLRQPATLSGIFHNFLYRPVGPAGSPLAKANFLLRKLIFARLLAHPQLRSVFYLDPYAVRELGIAEHPLVVSLPTPVRVPAAAPERVSALRAELGIDPGRTVALLFGLLEARKGISQLCAALRLLPAELQRQLCIVLAGEAEAPVQQRLAVEAESLHKAHSLQIRCCFGRVPEADVSAYFALADVVLQPYQRHVGSSGVMLIAAAAQRPILYDDFGWMGYTGARYGLGLGVDATQPAEIARGLTRLLCQSPEARSNRASMKELAEQNTPEGFARTIFERITNHD